MTKIQQIKHRQSVEYWKKIIAAQRSSGVNATEYCRQQNINYNAFYYWLRKIRQDIIDASEKLPVTAASSTTQFAVLSAASVTTVKQTDQNASLKLTIGPVVMEITEQTSPKLLRQTLKCLREVFPTC